MISLIIEHPWILYWIGFIIVYLIIRKHQQIRSLYGWDDFVIRVFWSFFSWVMLIVICVASLIEKFPKKPPKWL